MTDYGPLYEQDPDDIGDDPEKESNIDFDEVSLEKALVRIKSEFQQSYSNLLGILGRINETGWDNLPDHVKMLLREEAEPLMEQLTKLSNLEKSITQTQEAQKEWEDNDQENT
jgi:hypothetical protein